MNQQALAAYTLDGAPVARERFYALACDPQRSVVVEACAGAGKTWMLVSRILRALLEGAAPQDIVAITFTRKAAGEMRARLSEWLHEFAHGDEAGRRAALIQRGMAPAQAAELAPQLATLQQRLLQGGRQVEIRTFHAWFSQLLRAAPLELLEAQGIAPELQLLEDESELMPELWQRFHAAVLAEPALLAAYQDLVLSQGRGRLQSWLEAAFAKRVEIRLAQQSGRLARSLAGADSVLPECAGLAHPLELFAALRGALQALAIELGQAKNATPRKAATAIEQALGLEDAEAFAAVFEALFTASGTPRKNLGESPALSAMLDALERLQRALEQHQAALWHEQMSALALCLLEQFEQLKRARGLVDMNDLERGALALLSDAPLAGWVQERLDSQVKHLLIDEFQDTSPLQWHALHAWLSGYVGAGGGASGQRPPSVFIVGDPKQSIYRFRRAEPRVFAAARDFLREGLAGVLLACDHTRRNAPPVLAAVNAAFDAASRAQEYSGFRPHTTESGGAAALDGVFFIDAGADEESEPALAADADEQAWRPSLTQPRHEPELHRRAAEAQRIARCIAALLAEGQVLPGEIFVLARKREGLRVLAQTLKALGLPHVAPEEQLLLDSPDVRDLLALLDALASPGHNLSLAHALRSPLFGAAESDLLLLAGLSGSADWLGRERDPQAPRQAWWAALMLAPQAELSPALQRARGLLERWQQLSGARSPHDLLDAIVHEGELMARLAAAVPASERRARLHAVEALLALALDLDGGRYAGLYGFVRALKSRALNLPAAAEPEAVQLLTVHGAKGLEARVVFLMDCDAGPARAESTSLAVAWPVQEASPAIVAFLASESRPPPSLQALLDDEREQRQREELNALYVAMTRARSRLVISRTPGKRAPAGATWWSRLQPLAQAWPLPAAPAVDGAAPDRPVLLRQLPPAPPRAPQPPAAAAEMGQGPAVVDDSAALGEALHRVLEWHSGPRGAAQTLERLLAAAAQMYGLDAKRSERLERCARAILASADCAPFFDPQGLLWAGNEVAVSWRGQDMRLDRLVSRRGDDGRPVWWVLDYKLNPAPQLLAEYLQQLWRYREALRQLQPGEPVRTAFITGQGRLIDCTELIEAHAIAEST